MKFLYFKRSLIISIYAMIFGSIIFAMNSNFSDTETSTQESSYLLEEKPYYIFSKIFTDDIRMWYGSAMTSPNYEAIEQKNKLEPWDSEDSGTEQDYAKQIKLFEERNQMLIDMQLLEPVAKIYYLERRLSSQISQDNFEKIDINNLGLNILEVSTLLHDSTNTYFINKIIDFSYKNKYYPDREEERINPILKLINLFGHFLSHYHDYDREKYIEMAIDFFNNLKTAYSEYLEYNGIDIGHDDYMLSKIPVYIRNFDENILVMQILEYLKKSSYNDAFNSMKKYNETYGFLQGFLDQNFESIIFDLIENNKIEELIDAIFTQIMLSDENQIIFKLDLVDFLLKIEEILLYEYSNSNDKKIKEQLYVNINNIFDEFLNYDKENIDELREFIDGTVFDFTSDEGFMPSILELCFKNQLNIFIDKYKHLIEKYIGFVGILDSTFFEWLNRISDFEGFEFQFDTIFNSIFIDDYEIETSKKMYFYIEILRNHIFMQKDSIEEKIRNFLKEYNLQLDLKINKSNSYEKIDSLTSERFLVELQTSLDLLILNSNLKFFEHFISSYKNDDENMLSNKSFIEFRDKVRKDFMQIKNFRFET